MKIGIPQVLYVALASTDMGFVIGLSGHPRPPYDPHASLIGWLITTAILVAGGFFKDKGGAK